MNYANKIEFIKAEYKNFYVDKGPENGVLQGTKYQGAATHARNCLYTLVKMLKPRNCLEIGSMHYESSDSMGRAMDEVWGNDAPGVVDTFDIKRGGYTGEVNRTPTNHRVRPGFWYPFATTYDLWKYNDPDIVFPEFRDLTDEEVRNRNLQILSERANTIGGTYDLIFVDGDHSFKGAKEDYDIAVKVSNPNTVIVLDNVWDSRLYDVRKFYNSLPNVKWDFEEWNDANYTRNMVMDNAIILPY